ncbi:ABC transporter permease subunit [Caballeronia sp. LZ035]|uniref:ABC transporter permease subunit n=1 Tax=Caballeronia sp. LZ035 TaxID=3038568 RepID=UPI00285CFF56|nr:ATP-binding cassette domain-containing protein [Caballeronia sp. LZ035]MDR5761432.1 ATP-binding cassette domain-containing protein [Caballeronia sp. LZ035]
MQTSSSIRAVAGVAAVACALAVPYLADTFTVLAMTVYVVMAILALSLAFVWGHGGILCFGQSAFFGLGAYGYAIASLNLGPGVGAIVIGIGVATLAALLLGYFMFYGGISDVYLGVITLAVTLILFNGMNSTSGDAYRIGAAPLGGFNGIPSIPALLLPGFDEPLSPEAMFKLAALVLVFVYFGLWLLQRSRFGRIVAAVRENEQRALLLGYHVNRFKLATFAIGGGIAGLAGVLYANWGAFVSPGVFGMSQSAQIIIWVLVGGRGTLIGPVIACIGLQWLVAALGTQQVVDTGLVLGAILTLFVLAIPRHCADGGGCLPTHRRTPHGPRHRGRVASPEGRHMNDILLETRGLGVSFGGVHAVRDVNFALARGEVRCLIGPNGAGKSTFFRMLSGQLAPTRGEITFDGVRLDRLDTWEVARLGIGIKTQVPSVFEGLSVRENLALAAARRPGAHGRRDIAAIVDETLAMTELAAFAEVATNTLAHGHRQWVELGIILASRPTLVLLDEPAAGMTFREVRRTAELVGAINAHSTIVVVEHDMAFIGLIAQRVTVFNQGSILAEGTFEEITAHPEVRAAYLGQHGGRHA